VELRLEESIQGVLAFAFALFPNTFTVVFFFHIKRCTSSHPVIRVHPPQLLCKNHIELIISTKIEAYTPPPSAALSARLRRPETKQTPWNGGGLFAAFYDGKRETKGQSFACPHST
jgi:hypothetical protein